MTNRWLLPDHIADVLPTQARALENARRALLDGAGRYGFELVIPPLVEHLESLQVGTGIASRNELDLQTFKLVDQLSGRSLAVRADTTPQVARIDAHLLNRQGLARLCYCGSVLHTKPATPHASREPLQFGAEIYGHAGLEADLEVIELALESLRTLGQQDALIDVSDVRVVQALLSEAKLDAAIQRMVYDALAAKNGSAIAQATELPEVLRQQLLTVLTLHGDAAVIQQAATALPDLPMIRTALDSLQWLSQHLQASGVAPERIRFDLADLGSYGYYTATRFALYGAGANDHLARGGRYDEVGLAFGRSRPAVGFSLDLKMLVQNQTEAVQTAIRAPWSQDAGLRQTVRDLRNSGHTVVCVLPGHESEADEFACDRELIKAGQRWVVQSLPARSS